MWQKKAILALALHLAALSLSGCGASWFTFRDNNPVIEDYAGTLFGDKHMFSFATKASHRMVLIKKDGEKTITCAEPPPDVAEAFSSAMHSVIKVTNPQKIDIAAEFARQMATQVAPLLYRSQALQFYRDEMHTLCIARMNGWITDVDYKTISMQRYEQGLLAVKDEMPKMAEVIKAYFESVKAGSATIEKEKDKEKDKEKEKDKS